MNAFGLRLHGKEDLRLEAFELPAPKDDEIVASVVTNSICMSDHKAAMQGEAHKRVPDNVAEAPIIIGHEFCGEILQVGAAYRGQFEEGMKYSVQPALNIPGREIEAPGYSFPTIGGQTDKVVIPREVMEQDCLLEYNGDGYFNASVSEPVSCIVGAFKTSYHFTPGEYVHEMGIRRGGKMAVLAGAGPMGLLAVDYAIHGPMRPGLLVITDIDDERLARAAAWLTPEHAKEQGVDLHYLNTREAAGIEQAHALADGAGYDDVHVFAPVQALIAQGDALLGNNGCLNFFAGPSTQDFSAPINLYDVHYSGHHVVGSSGGNTQDLRESLDLMAEGTIRPALMITHVGGITCAGETTLGLPKIPGGKKLIYTQRDLPLFALDDLPLLAEKDAFYAPLAEMVAANNGLWSVDAEKYLLANASPVSQPGDGA